MPDGHEVTLGSVAPVEVLVEVCEHVREVRSLLDKLEQCGTVRVRASQSALDVLDDLLRWPRARWASLEDPLVHRTSETSTLEAPRTKSASRKRMDFEGVDVLVPIDGEVEERTVTLRVSYEDEGTVSAPSITRVSIDAVVDEDTDEQIPVTPQWKAKWLNAPKGAGKRLSMRDRIYERLEGGDHHYAGRIMFNKKYAAVTKEFDDAVAGQVKEIEKQVALMNDMASGASPGSLTKVMLTDEVAHLREQVRNLKSPTSYGSQSKNSDFYKEPKTAGARRFLVITAMAAPAPEAPATGVPVQETQVDPLGAIKSASDAALRAIGSAAKAVKVAAAKGAPTVKTASGVKRLDTAKAHLDLRRFANNVTDALLVADVGSVGESVNALTEIEKAAVAIERIFTPSP